MQGHGKQITASAGISVREGRLRVELKRMPTGTVAFFHDRKGYGFIESDDSDEDVFFHMEDVGGEDLQEGQEVEFEITSGAKGPRATNLTRL